MAEQLALQQMLRDRSAVDRHKLAMAADAPGMDSSGDELFARATLSGNKNRRIEVFDSGDKALDPAESLAFSDQKNFGLRAVHVFLMPRL